MVFTKRGRMVAQCRRGRAECGVAAAVLGQTPGHRPVTSYTTRVIAVPVRLLLTSPLQKPSLLSIYLSNSTSDHSISLNFHIVQAYFWDSVSRLYLTHLSNIQIQELDLSETCQCKQNHTTFRQVKRSSTFIKGLNLHINISFQYQASKASH